MAHRVSGQFDDPHGFPVAEDVHHVLQIAHVVVFGREMLQVLQRAEGSETGQFVARHVEHFKAFLKLNVFTSYELSQHKFNESTVCFLFVWQYSKTSIIRTTTNRIIDLLESLHETDSCCKYRGI